MPLLQLNAIRKKFGATHALDGVDLNLLAGEVHALIGENGAGKSTLMNVLSGAFPPDEGEMFLNGTPYLPTDPLDARKHGIVHIHQELSLCPHLSVAENILLGSEPSNFGIVNRDAMHERTRELLKIFGREEITPETLVAQLSPASRQIVEICRALAWDAKVILMDEPTSSLECKDVKRLFASIRRLSASGIGVVYISHFLEEVREIAQKFTVVRDGKTVGTGAIADVTDKHLITMMVGREVDSSSISYKTIQQGDVVLRVKQLEFPPVLADASFELHRGEILGIAGLIGSGRTEMVRALFGLAPCSAESIEVYGKTVPAMSLSALKSIANGIGYLSEDRNGEGLFRSLSVEDNLLVTRTPSNRGWIDFPQSTVDTMHWISQLQIKTSGPKASMSSLSGGNQQKILLGRVMQQNADILLIDEPTRGVDIGSRTEIYEQIMQLAASGKSILVVSSYLPELFLLCHRLAVMSKGCLSTAKSIKEWTSDSVMQAAIGSSSNAA